MISILYERRHRIALILIGLIILNMLVPNVVHGVRFNSVYLQSAQGTTPISSQELIEKAKEDHKIQLDEEGKLADEASKQEAKRLIIEHKQFNDDVYNALITGTLQGTHGFNVNAGGLESGLTLEDFGRAPMRQFTSVVGGSSTEGKADAAAYALNTNLKGSDVKYYTSVMKDPGTGTNVRRFYTEMYPNADEGYRWSRFKSGFLMKSYHVDYKELVASAVINNNDKLEGVDLHLDTYGNVVVDGGQIVVPFYLNNGFIEKLVRGLPKANFAGDGDPSKAENFIAFPLTSGEVAEIKKLNGDVKKGKRLSGATVRGVYYVNSAGKIVVKGDMEYDDFLSWLSGAAHNEIDTKKTAELLKGSLKAPIKKRVNEMVNKHADMMAYPEKYSLEAHTGEGAGTSLEDEKNNLGSLLEEFFKDGGVTFFKVTVANIAIEIYENIFVNFSSKYIFRTDSYEDSVAFYNLIGAYITLVVVLLGLYVAIGAIKILRGQHTLMTLLKRTAVVAAVCLVPVFAYGTLVDKTFNEAPNKLAAGNIKQTLVLDRWTEMLKVHYDNDMKTRVLNLNREFRKTSNDYLVEYNTDQFVNKSVEDKARERLENSVYERKGHTDIGLTVDEEIEYEISRLKDKRVKLDVDANHIINYFKGTKGAEISQESIAEGAEEDAQKIEDAIESGQELMPEIEDRDVVEADNLFEFLYVNYPEEYGGLGEIDDYYSLVGSDGKLETSGKDNDSEGGGLPGGTISEYKHHIYPPNTIWSSKQVGKMTFESSEMGKALFDHLKEQEVDMLARLRLLNEYVSSPLITNAEKEMFIDKICKANGNDYSGAYSSIVDDAGLDALESYKYSLEKSIMEELDYGDLTGVRGFLERYSVMADTASGVEEARRQDKLKKIENIIYNVNYNMIEDYLDLVISLDNTMGISTLDDDILGEALTDVVQLDLYFELNNEIDSKFPSSMDMANVESDVYMRSLIVPRKDMTPGNLDVKNAAVYMRTKDIVTMLLFIGAILSMTAYGLLKMVVISKVLLPAMLILMVFNYVIRDDKENKTIHGAAILFGTFAAVHWGYMLLWRIAVDGMNKGLSAGAVRSSFFNTTTNSIVTLLYFVTAMKFLIVPTVKTAVKNPLDLGGSANLDRMKDKLTASGAFDGLLTAMRLKVYKDVLDNRKRNKGKNENSLLEDFQLAKKKEAQRKEKAKENSMLNKAKRGVDGLSQEFTESLNKRVEGEDATVVDKAMNKTKDVIQGTGDAVKEGIDDAKDGVEAATIGRKGKSGIRSRKMGATQVKKKDKDVLDRLHKKGVFTGVEKVISGGGLLSNSMKLGSHVVAREVADILDGLGIQAKAIKDTVHFVGSADHIAEVSDVVNKELAKRKEELAGDAKGEMVDSVAQSRKVNDMRMDYDERLHSRLQDLVDAGRINGVKRVNTMNGPELVVTGDPDGLADVTDLVGGEFEDLTGSLRGSNRVEFDNNIAVRDALDELGVDYTLYGDGDEERLMVDIDSLPRGKSADSLMTDVEEISRDLYEINKDDNIEYEDVGSTKVFRVNGKSPLIKQRVQGKLIEGIDYYEDSKGNYVSVTNKGARVLKSAHNFAKRNSDAFGDKFDISDMTITSSTEFKDNVGDSKVYSAGNVYGGVGRLQKHLDQMSKKDPSQRTDLEKELVRTYYTLDSVDVVGDSLVMVGHNEMSDAEVNKFLKEAQRSLYEADEKAKIERAKQEAKKKKEEDKKKEEPIDVSKLTVEDLLKMMKDSEQDNNN